MGELTDNIQAGLEQLITSLQTQGQTTMRKRLARKLFLWSCRLNNEWHGITVTDQNGNLVAEFGAYQDVSYYGPDKYTFTCTCERS